MLEFDRSLLYLAALVLFGSVVRTEASVRWIVRGIAVAIVVIAVVALTTRVLPEVWPTAGELYTDRLSYPLGYSNSLGLLMVMGIVLCLHLTSDPREPPTSRVLGAAAIPVFASTLYFTFSRGAIAAGIVGLAVYLVVGRPRLLVTALLAAGPATLVALLFAYDADVLATDNAATPAGIEQGHRVAVAVAICLVAALALRWLLVVLLDDRMLLAKGPAALRRRGPQVAIAATAVVLLGGVAVSADVPQRLDRTYDRFIGGTLSTGSGVNTGKATDDPDQRARLFDAANNGRLDYWRVASRRFEHDRLKGDGTGSYVDAWLHDRPVRSDVITAYSLYMETLAELGLVGLALLLIVVVVILARLATLARGPTRSLYASLMAVGVAWALAAGVDWQWDMPAPTIVVFAAGGAALAAAASRRQRPASPAVRLVVGAGCVIACVTPALVWYSQSRLLEAQDAYNVGDCREAGRQASRSFSALGMRPEPLEILAYCDMRAGDPALALEAAQRAVELQPGDWRMYYNRAVTLAASGQDPRPDARTALRLNRLEPIAQNGARRLSGAGPRQWRAAAQLLYARPAR